ncbi:hypothetical protein U2P60_13175 [Brucella sp. H1_1004]|uniref:hypothetical protein n=1 Tax=Brucella sp. H1_1004 TaxID=3110109 RepID=UPI0039B5D648
MFKITFSPQVSEEHLLLSKAGDVLIINGDALDFSELPEGGEYPAEAIENDFIIGGVTRNGGEIKVTVLLPYQNPDAPTSLTYPVPISVLQ